MGNYLRVRGEYLDGMDSGFDGLELPPRARRILTSPLVVGVLGGTTSACAENTENFLFVSAGERNYLRVRGEYAYLDAIEADSQELPPRARRIPCS